MDPGGLYAPRLGNIHVYLHNIQTGSPLKHLANQSQVLCEASLGWGNQCVYKLSRHMTIYGKSPSKIFSGTGGPINETGHEVSMTQVLQCVYKS